MCSASGDAPMHQASYARSPRERTGADPTPSGMSARISLGCSHTHAAGTLGAAAARIRTYRSSASGPSLPRHTREKSETTHWNSP